MIFVPPLLSKVHPGDKAHWKYGYYNKTITSSIFLIFPNKNIVGHSIKI